jgi:FAD/FMN-containing dehydrogenase
MAFATKDNSETAEASGVARIKAVARQTVSAEGWPGLMTGAKVRVMKLAPNMALTLVMYETMQAALQPFLATP